MGSAIQFQNRSNALFLVNYNLSEHLKQLFINWLSFNRINQRLLLQ